MPIFKTSGVLVVAVCIGFIASLIAEGEGNGCSCLDMEIA